MQKEQATPPKPSRLKKRNTIIGVIAFVAVATLIVAQLTTPKRSVAVYCKTYKEEKARLAKLPGDTWSSAVFDEEASDASEFATSFAKLEKVAPNDIKSDVSTIKLIYQKIHDEPSRAVSASMSGLSAEDNVKGWTESHCK